MWHETSHRTAFKSKFWNDFFYQISSYMNNFEPVRWRYSHFKHHSFTAFNDPFDFEIVIRKPIDLFYFFSFFIPFFQNIFFIHKSLQVETLKHALGFTTDVMAQCIPEEKRSKCRNSARIHVAIWIGAIILSIIFKSWFPVLYIVLPGIYGATLNKLFGLTQHTGLEVNIKDHRYSSRTVYINPIFHIPSTKKQSISTLDQPSQNSDPINKEKYFFTFCIFYVIIRYSSFLINRVNCCL